MAIVSCPECSKKLKVADASIGKKVKCSCGKVFVAEAAAEAAPAVALATPPDKVMVACSECGAKLKVASTSLGKKMKCPKCAAIFTAALTEAAPAAPTKKAPPPAEFDDDDVDAPAPVKKGKAVSDDDMEDLFSFAQKDADKSADDNGALVADDEDDKPKAKSKPFDPSDLFEDEEEVKPKGKKKPVDDDDDEPRPKGNKKPVDDDDDDRPKSKFKKSAKPSKWDDDDDKPAEKAVYPRRILVNLFVFFLLFVYIALFAFLFITGDSIIDLGLPKYKPIAKPNIPKVREEEDAKKLEGTWTVESVEVNGKTDDRYKGQKFVFTTEKVTLPDIEAAVYKLKENETPRSMEIVAGENMTLSAIYELNEDKLQICVSFPKKDKDGKVVTADPPKTFDSKEGVLWKLKKQDDKDKDKGKDKDKSKDKDGEKDKDGDKDKGANKDKSVSTTLAGFEGTWTQGGTTLLAHPVGGGVDVWLISKMAIKLDAKGNFTAGYEKKQGAKIEGQFFDSKLVLQQGVPIIEGLEGNDWTCKVINENLILTSVAVIGVGDEPKPAVIALQKSKGKPTDKDKGQATIDLAKAQAATLTTAVQAYALKNDGQFPQSLNILLEKDGGGPYLANANSLLDPWKQPFQYDLTGVKNNGKLPDIWTVAPDKQIIGNWKDEGKVRVLKLAPVKGTVTLDGKPIATGEIEFQIRGEPPIVLEIRDGAFAGKTHLGKNVVRINVYKDGPPAPAEPDKSPTKINTIPTKYNVESVLLVEVTATGPNDHNLQINSK